MRSSILLTTISVLLASCSPEPTAVVAVPGGGGQGQSAPSEFTVKANAEFAPELPMQDQADFEAARKGLVASEDVVLIKDSAGRVVWDSAAYAFEQGDAPASVNPSLWRQAKLNSIHGLFEVVDGVYQVRGYDLSNMSLIRGETGWIVVDPLTSEETASAALALARKHLGDDPVVAVVLTHSHIDHFGGVRAVVSRADSESGKVRIIAPQGFLEEATSENILAGLAMGRRATFMYGMNIERSIHGHVDSGLGKAPARGTFAILPPTELVDRTPQEMIIDGVRFVFQYAPESEAPAELAFYLPDHKALCGAEIVSRNMHNLYTLRGAKVRDALKWSGYIHEVLELFPDVDVLFASHHWPTWGKAQVVDYLEKQRDTYKFIHDQTLRLASRGFTSQEIAELLILPTSLRSSFGNRGYYGTTKHNAKAVYQNYFGWYDANPANLDPLPPTEAAVKYVEFMGGAEQLLAKARQSVDQGEYRWAATVLNHLVFAEPDLFEAKTLLAEVYDQLGYRAESGPWRDVYLSAGYELRHGPTGSAIDPIAAVALLSEMPLHHLFEAMATRVLPEKAEGTELKINFVFTDRGESFVLTVKNSVLNYRRAEPAGDADVTFRVTHELWLQLATGQAGIKDLVFSDDVSIEGSRLKLVSFFGLLDDPDGAFAIVTP